ncbi:MAG: hypothetical protein ACUVT4_12180, partial [Actinomycetota bacterium]
MSKIDRDTLLNTITCKRVTSWGGSRGEGQEDDVRCKAEALFADCIDLMFCRYGRGERIPCPEDTCTAKIVWDLWQLREHGAPFKNIEDLVHSFCRICGAPVKEVHAFVFEEDSIYGRLEIP